MRVIGYVDGFNLYYRGLRGTPYKWLNVLRLLELEVPASEIVRVRYFTARIKGRPDDPDKPKRQDVYLRALRTTSPLDIILGKYQSYPEEMELVAPIAGGPRRASVWNTEEKGSDVNLATWMLLDAFDRQMDCAVVVSNDSDLLMPVRQLRNRFGTTVVVLSPDRVQPNLELKAVSNIFKEIRASTLAAAQFPDEIVTPTGTRLRKPEAWKTHATWQDELRAIRDTLPSGD